MTSQTPAADRLLRTASALFAKEGIRAVGIDRILAEAGTAKATLYHAFGSKEALVVAYLEQRDVADRRAYRKQAAVTDEGIAQVFVPFDLAEKAAAGENYVGCVYANALNEFPDPAHPVALAVRRHRDWIRDQWIEALSPAQDAVRMAEEIQVTYDGALFGAKAAQSPQPIRRARELVKAAILPTAHTSDT
ncbi:AcrR family transcriptional regulator [Leucobacter exalbidus]|uniref:AcrR family transcriptional regulator n=1 Tax=Leucobacter exalbidus TaxID=662960 RepID=A0A940PX54_9MICO|nr:AcrR family transcriptional regulator [Leucobacter exalbidus]